jgi:leucyl aminopeptidase
MHPVFCDPRPDAVPVWFVTGATWPDHRAVLTGAQRAFVDAAGFEPKPGRHLVLPSPDGSVAGVLFAIENDDSGSRDPFLPGSLPSVLPTGVYRFANAPHDVRLAALAFALGSYRFARYRKAEQRKATLAVPDGVDAADLSRVADAVGLARDLINTPSNDMGPAELEEAVRRVGEHFGARVSAVIGDDLLRQNFPLIHAVGRASVRAPRLIELRWGNPAHPRVTLVGKGVCFDSGGLDIKPESAMLLMKKDMGGAATLLALAQMIMDRGLKIALRLLVPAVENAVSGAAFRPLDVYRSRKGLTVEVGNTDAEGRLVLADALAFADEEAPELLVDMGTLTGAARVALGPELPPYYTDDAQLAQEIESFSAREYDPIWRMPLWAPYQSMLDSKVADLNNVSSGRFAGSITCALFLKRFVTAAKSWAHFDIYAWNSSARPARPEGGECQGARLLYALLCERYG